MLRRWSHVIKRLHRNRRGSAIVEFAVISPVMLMIWAGSSEVTHAIDEWRKLTLYARTIADMTSQGDTQNPLDANTTNDIIASAALVMRPFDTSTVKVAVSAMGVDLVKYGLNPQVCTSVANANRSARAIGQASDLTVPLGYQITGMRYMLAEVSVTYTPMIGAALGKIVPSLKNAITFSVSVPWPARGGQHYGTNMYTEVVLPSANPKACDGSAP